MSSRVEKLTFSRLKGGRNLWNLWIFLVRIAASFLEGTWIGMIPRKGKSGVKNISRCMGMILELLRWSASSQGWPMARCMEIIENRRKGLYIRWKRKCNAHQQFSQTLSTPCTYLNSIHIDLWITYEFSLIHTCIVSHRNVPKKLALSVSPLFHRNAPFYQIKI